MRTPTLSICTAALFAAASLYSAAHAETVAPGKPAGVQAAQMGDKEWLVFGGIGVLVSAVLIANAGSGDHAAVATQPITVVTPTTT
jgi:hypothetical protein